MKIIQQNLPNLSSFAYLILYNVIQYNFMRSPFAIPHDNGNKDGDTPHALF